MKAAIQVGLLLRNQVRKEIQLLAMDATGFSWYEDKGLLCSVFYLKGRPSTIRMINRWVEENKL